MPTVVKKRKLNVEALSGGLSLPGPEDVNQVPDDFAAYSKLIFGPKGCGKTTLASKFPDSIVFMWEFGRVNLPIRQIPRRNEDPLNWSRFRSYVDLVLDDDSVKTPVIDTVDLAYLACMDYTCRQAGVQKPSDLGRDSADLWNAIRDEFAVPWKLLTLGGKPPLFISHDRNQEIVSRLGGKFDQIVPTCTPACWRYLEQTCDFVFYLGRKGNRRILTVRGDEVITASAQAEGHFLTPDGKEIQALDLGTQPNGLYEKIINAFNNKETGFELNPYTDNSND